MSNERVPIMHSLFILLRLKTLEITLANLQFFPLSICYVYSCFCLLLFVYFYDKYFFTRNQSCKRSYWLRNSLFQKYLNVKFTLYCHIIKYLMLSYFHICITGFLFQVIQVFKLKLAWAFCSIFVDNCILNQRYPYLFHMAYWEI